MVWNVFGWVGLQLSVNLLHHDDDLSYCSKSFCYCEVGDGEDICTCHHHDEMVTSDHHPESDSKEMNHFCSYNAPHNVPVAASFSMITHDFHAFFNPAENSERIYKNIDFPSPELPSETPGHKESLFRPPIG